MTTYERALAFAREFHAGQVDKAGVPYIEHPLAVAAQCEGEQEKIVALLHDTLEDTAATYADIEAQFGEEVADAVLTLTHNEGEPYEAYILRVKQHPLAKRVKIADLSHNSDLRRFKQVTQRDLDRHAKYLRAMEVLLADP